MKKGLIAILAWLLNQSMAQAQYDSTSLKATVSWIVSTLTQNEVVILKDGMIYEDIRVQAFFDNHTQELVLEKQDYIDNKLLFYTRTTLPLRLLEETIKEKTGGEVTPETEQYYYNRKAGIPLTTIGGKAAITRFHRNVEDNTQRTEYASSCSIIVYYGQLKKDKQLAHKLSGALHHAIRLAKQSSDR